MSIARAAAAALAFCIAGPSLAGPILKFTAGGDTFVQGSFVVDFAAQAIIRANLRTKPGPCSGSEDDATCFAPGAVYKSINRAVFDEGGLLIGIDAVSRDGRFSLSQELIADPFSGTCPPEFTEDSGACFLGYLGPYEGRYGFYGDEVEVENASPSDRPRVVRWGFGDGYWEGKTVSVPEPSSVAILLVAGLSAVTALVRRRRAASPG
jgi:hypothetical protein